MKNRISLFLVVVLAGCSSATTYQGQPVEYWLAQLHHPEATSRYQASIALGKIGKPAVPGLRQALQDTSPAVRLAAAGALAKMYREAADALPELIPLLQDSDPAMQAAAARAIGRLDKLGAAAVPALVPLLESKEAKCRYEAADALGRIGEEAARAAPALAQLLHDPDLKVRQLVARQIGRTQAPQVIPQLIAALEDEDRQVRMYAGQSLRKIDPHVAKQHGYW